MYKIIEENYSHEIEVKKSRFICCVFFVENEKDILKYLENVKNIYPKATHYCYAYILDGKEKCTDDKEPSGTAGIPILNILKKKNLTNILCIVVRYFGGIKLGVGGLLRAYNKSVIECLNNVNMVSKIDKVNLKIIFTYSKLKEIEYFIKNYEIISKNYDENNKR